MSRNRPISKLSDAAKKRLPDFEDENASRTDPFLAPEEYFDELPQRVMDRITADSQEKQENPQPSPLLRKVWMSAALVAAIAVIFMMVKPSPMVPTAKSPATSQTASNLSAEYDQTYADEALMIALNAVTDKDIATINYDNFGYDLSGSDTTAITQDEIIQYLLEENDGGELIAAL